MGREEDQEIFLIYQMFERTNYSRVVLLLNAISRRQPKLSRGGQSLPETTRVNLSPPEVTRVSQSQAVADRASRNSINSSQHGINSNA